MKEKEKSLEQIPATNQSVYLLNCGDWKLTELDIACGIIHVVNKHYKETPVGINTERIRELLKYGKYLTIECVESVCGNLYQNTIICEATDKKQGSNEVIKGYMLTIVRN